MQTYPVAILEDRYSGVYANGRWLALAGATEPLADGLSRVAFCLESDDGPSGSDVEAGLFWAEPPSWIAVGNTPDEAFEKLKDSMK